MTKRIFIDCEECRKRLIERLPNGLFRFRFGKDPQNPGESPVSILIRGDIQIKCFRSACGHINTLNYFPFGEKSGLESQFAEGQAIIESENERIAARHKDAEVVEETRKRSEIDRASRSENVCAICGQYAWWDQSTTSYRCNDHTSQK